MQSQDTKLFKKIIAEKRKRARIEAKGRRNSQPNFQSLSHALDEYYLYNKLREYCAYLSYHNIVEVESSKTQQVNFAKAKDIFELFKLDEFKSPIVETYILIKALYEKINQKTATSKPLFDQLVALLKESKDSYSSEDQIEVFSFLTNYCIKKINTGELQFNNALFHYSNEIVNLLFGPKGSKKALLPASMFKNMVTAAFYIKENFFF